jgi:hypothetical protein
MNSKKLLPLFSVSLISSLLILPLQSLGQTDMLTDFGQTMYLLGFPFQIFGRINKIIDTNEKTISIGSCRNIINDNSGTPANIRLTPKVNPNNSVGTLENGTVIEVVQQYNSWLEISKPLQGWVSVGITSVTCVPPNGRTSQSFEVIASLGDAATKGNRYLGDMLVRYSANADGAIADVVGSSLTRWAEKNPKFLVEVLRGQPEEIYERALILIYPARRAEIKLQLQEILRVR